MPSRWPADPAAGAPWRAPAALAVMVASGFAGLGYQIVWTQQCALWLGHESAALLAVVTAFFGGLALGALAFGARIERSAQPARWYAAGEGVVALWSLALLGLMGPVSAGLLALTGARPAPAWQWAVAFAGTFLMLLPATAAMGATLPAMARLLAPLRWQARRVAALYACNTLGAVIGVLAAAFWLVPTWGLARTAGLCAVLSGLCAGAALALLLAVYLVGTALGAAAYARGWAGPPEPDLRQAGPLHAAPQDRRADRLLCALALACLLGAASLWAADSTRDAVQRALGPGMAPALAAEATLALAAFLLPTVLMGALFSRLTLRARSAGVALGRALGANTLGAAAAPLLLGVLSLPALGAKGALLALLLGYLALLLRRAWARPGAWVAAGLVPRWRWVHRRWCLSMCPTVAASSASVVLHAKRDIKPRLCARDVVENPRDAYGHRCGFRLATGANPSVFLSRAQRATPH